MTCSGAPAWVGAHASPPGPGVRARVGALAASAVSGVCADSVGAEGVVQGAVRTEAGDEDGRGILAVTAVRAARASSTVVPYRSPGSFAIPVAITVSSCGDTPGRVIEGRGGGVVRWPAICCSTLSPGKGRLEVRHSYS